MTAFTPHQGDYFEVKDLTKEQFEKIVSLYKPYVKTHRATWAAVNHDSGKKLAVIIRSTENDMFTYNNPEIVHVDGEDYFQKECCGIKIQWPAYEK